MRNGVASNPDLKARIPGLTVNGHGDLDLRVLGVTRVRSRLRVFLDLFTGRIADNRRYQQYSDAEYDLELPDGPYRIARDGELGEEISRLSARVLPRALTVIVPARGRKD